MVMNINTYREKAAVAAAISKPCTLHRVGTGVYYMFAHGVLHTINMIELAGVKVWYSRSYGCGRPNVSMTRAAAISKLLKGDHLSP